MGQSLYSQTVPVLARYLRQLDGFAVNAGAALSARLIEDGFSALDHSAIAQGYALRIVMPLVGQDVPELDMPNDAVALKRRGDQVLGTLTALTPNNFLGADKRIVRHQAGDVMLEQSAEEFVTLYGLPNFFFHISTAHAILRQKGQPVGKGDFDGFHSYAPGFSFVKAPAKELQ